MALRPQQPPNTTTPHFLFSGWREEAKGWLNHAQAFGQGSSGTARMLGSVVFRLPQKHTASADSIRGPAKSGLFTDGPTAHEHGSQRLRSSHLPFPTGAGRYRPKKAGPCLRPSSARSLAMRYSATAEVSRKSQQPLRAWVGDGVTAYRRATWNLKSWSAEHSGGSRRNLGSVVQRGPYSCGFMAYCFALLCRGGRTSVGLVPVWRETISVSRVDLIFTTYPSETCYFRLCSTQ